MTPVLGEFQNPNDCHFNTRLHEGRGIVHIDYVESDQLVRVAPAPMTRHSLELTAQGKMVLSRRRDLFDPVTRPELKAELREIQRSGVAWNREATVPGMIALATPGFTNHPTEPILAVAWPVNRFSEAKGEAAVQAIRAALLEHRQRLDGAACLLRPRDSLPSFASAS